MPTQIGSRQLRSSSALCARKLAKRLAKSWQGGSGRGSGGRGGGGEGGGGGAGTAVIKSNNPHLADGEQHAPCNMRRIPNHQDKAPGTFLNNIQKKQHDPFFHVFYCDKKSVPVSQV